LTTGQFSAKPFHPLKDTRYRHWSLVSGFAHCSIFYWYDAACDVTTMLLFCYIDQAGMKIALPRQMMKMMTLKMNTFAMIGKTTFYRAPQCSHCKRCTSYDNSVRLSVLPSVRLSVCPSVTRRYCFKTTARSTVQFALLDSKMCLVL